MIEFRKITDEIFGQCIKLDAGDNGKFVAPNTVSLAQAYLSVANDTGIPMPYAIYKDDAMVGFIMLGFFREDQDEDLDEDVYDLWRFMIDKKYQGKGYGREALIKAIELIKTLPHGPANKLLLSYVPGNEVGSTLYESVGFKDTGEVSDGEIVMAYDLNRR